MTKNLKNQLKSLDIKKLKLKNGSTIEKELKRHSKILADCLLTSLDKVYDSYEANIYHRTYKLYNSLYIDGMELCVSGKKTVLSISIRFDKGAIHKSFDGKEVNTAILLNEGWQTHGSFQNIPYLGYRAGEHWIERGILEYKSKVSKPFPVKFTINDEVRMF